MQTTYKLYSDALSLGLPSDTIDRQIDSYATEGLIQFGEPVAYGTNKLTQVKKVAAINTIIGFAVRSENAIYGEYRDKASIGVLKMGRITVVASVAVVAGDPVYVTAAGAVTNVAGSNGNQVGVFKTTQTVAGGLAVVELNLIAVR